MHDHDKGVKGLNKRGFQIEDWTGRVIEKFGLFDSCEAAWSVLYQEFPDDEDLEDYEVVCIACKNAYTAKRS